MVKEEIRFIKNDYKNETEKTSILKSLLLFTLKLLLKTIYYLTLGFIQICIAIFMIILFTPLYMFFGVKPKLKRNKRGF